jgi:DNA modification methylase
MYSKFLLILLLLFTFHIINAQSNFYYKGKIVKSKGTCTWLIRITETNDLAFKNKLINPTGNLPEYFLKRGTKIQFGMDPLRQSVPDGCKANVVASIVNPEKL